MRERRLLSLGDFRGVDFSTSPLNVSAWRASDMCNFILEDGKTKKRPGWRERFSVEGKQINGIFSYREGQRQDLIVHAGCRFYRVAVDEYGNEYLEDITESGTYDMSKVQCGLLTDTRSQAFFMKKRMYVIGCGDFLVYGTWDNGKTYELRRVFDDEDTYIPVTTVSIGDIYNVDDNGNFTEDIRESLDGVNLMTGWRKNKLQGYSKYVETSNLSPTYKLDASVDANYTVTVTNELTGETLVSEPSSSGPDTLLLRKDMDSGTKGRIDVSTGEITFDKDWVGKDNGDSFITVQFYHTPTAKEAMIEEADFIPYEDRITKCCFGIQYGIDGNVDRLFMAGNPSFPNVDFFSEADDYTYFSDISTIANGAEAQAIVGYSRLSDNTLAVFKERGGADDASIFYRTGHYDQSYDANGNIKRILPIFPTAAGNAGETLISRHASLDFGGDNLILSRNGVYAIVLTDNVTTNTRYTRERGRSIHARLMKEENLEDAVAISYNHRYYLAVNGHCYVADARYKYQAVGDMDGSYNYEWWYWDHVPARVFAEVDGALMFGTADGRICVFDEAYSDRTLTQCEEGQLTVDASNNNRIDYHEALGQSIREGNEICFYTPGIYALLGDTYTVADGRISVDIENIGAYIDGETVYADGVGDSGLALNTQYRLNDVDVGSCSFCLVDPNGNPVSVRSGGFRLIIPLSGRKLYITDVTEKDFHVKVWGEGAPVRLTDYNGSVPTMTRATITEKENVAARWVTPIFDLGNAALGKVLHRVTLTFEPGITGALSFGYETCKNLQMFTARGTSSPFSFDQLSFHEFTFNTGFAQSWTRRMYERDFNHIVFRFVSETDQDCSINRFLAEYKYIGIKGGVK